MIFKIGMPIFEDLMNWLDADDNDREDTKRVIIQRGNVEFRVCSCICAVQLAYFDSNKYSQYM